MKMNAIGLLFGIAFGGVLAASNLHEYDTIHFMHHFRRAFDHTGDVGEAIRETLENTGQALLFTSIALVVGFAVYLTADMATLVDFGIVNGFAVIAAFFSDIVLGPALVTLLVRDEHRG